MNISCIHSPNNTNNSLEELSMSNVNNRLITYTIYLITNEINGKNYVGKHKLQKNEAIESRRYMGSGAALNRAKQKYGIENFSKEILAICYSEKEENILENTIYRFI